MKYLGIDYGLKKIGLSVSEGQVASPLKVLEVSSLKDAVSKVSSVILKEEIDRVVIGVPESGEVFKAVGKFVGELKRGVREVEVIKTEETLSSSDAKNFMIELNVSMKKRGQEDAYAAVLILQRFLNSLS